MSVAMLKLPESVRMQDVPALWMSLEVRLRAEGAQVRSAAGTTLSLSGAELKQFDTGLLSLLLSAARCCSEQGLSLQLQNMPGKLVELARVYGVAELLWPELQSAAANATGAEPATATVI